MAEVELIIHSNPMALVMIINAWEHRYYTLIQTGKEKKERHDIRYIGRWMSNISEIEQPLFIL